MHGTGTTLVLAAGARSARRAASAPMHLAVVARVRLLVGLATAVALAVVAAPPAGAATPPLFPFNVQQWSGFVVVNTDLAEPLAGGPANTEVDTWRATTRYNKTLHPTLSGTVEHHSHIQTLIGSAVCSTDVWWPDDSGAPFTIPETALDPVTGGQFGGFAIFGDSGAYSVSPSFLFRRLVPELDIVSGTGAGCPPASRTMSGARTNFPFAPRIGIAPFPVGDVTRLEGSDAETAPPDFHEHLCWRVTWLADQDHDGIPDAEDPAPAIAAPATCASIAPPPPVPSAAACVSSVLASAKVTKAATLLKHRGFRIKCLASDPGTLTVALATVVRRPRITIAILKVKIAKAGTITRTVRLTKAGRRLLRRSRRRIRATLKVSYTIGAHTTTKSRREHITPLKR